MLPGNNCPRMPIDLLDLLPPDLVEEALWLDEVDPLGSYREEFVVAEDVVAYLDGNSLGRPLKITGERLSDFVAGEWGGRLIRGWDELWMEQPVLLGDMLGRVALGAAAGQTAIGDSTTVMLYKLLRAAVAARPERNEIIADTENFPTDRFILSSVAAEKELSIQWITPDPASGVQPAEVVALLSERTAVVVLSHTAYKSAYIADMGAITAEAHRVGALTLWDLCHSAGVVEVQLDETSADLAVGCTYKYLNGGPGAPAFGYVAASLQDQLTQPITGWIGDADPFGMGPHHQPAPGIRRFLSGTPHILGMLPLGDMLALLEKAGMPAVRAKSTGLTEFAIRLTDAVLAKSGVTIASPRDPTVRGGHVLLEHDSMQSVVAQLWDRGILPDFRPPRGLRAGLSPLSSSFTEVATAFACTGQLLDGGG